MFVVIRFVSWRIAARLRDVNGDGGEKDDEAAGEYQPDLGLTDLFLFVSFDFGLFSTHR
jgi:hypothetical protein